MRHPRFVTLTILTLLAAFTAATAAGDWLVTSDGAKVETKGPWKVKGRLVVFTLADGTLSSLRLSEVDLEASEAATAEALAPKEAAPEKTEAKAPEKLKEPVLTVTNKDIPRALPPPPSAEGAASEERVDSGRLLVEVIGWRQVENEDINGVEIQGTLQNKSREIAMDVTVAVTLRDADDNVIDTVNAFLTATSLAPNVTTNFRAVFPDALPLGEPEFTVRSQGVTISPVGEMPTGPGEGG